MDHQQQQEEDPDFLPSSPTNSSVSSSDLDTQSTGSFFPDRSTTLGTLMGVNFPSSSDAAAVRSVTVPLQDTRGLGGAVSRPAEAIRRRRSVGGRRRSWWRLCRDDMVGPTSLGDFLQIERGADVAEFAGEHVAVGGQRLFEDGRVLPPAPTSAAERRRRERVPVLLAGICSGGN